MLLNESEIRSLIIESLLLESSKKKFTKELIKTGKLPETEFLDKMWIEKRNKWRHPFSNDMYRSIVFNSMVADENHTVDEYITGFESIDVGIFTPYFQRGGNISPVLNPDGTVLTDIDPKIKDSTLTYDEATAFIDAKSKTNRGTNIMQSIIDNAIAKKENTDLDIIYKDENWIFFYPKSYNGSIAVSRMGGDLKYYGNAVHADSSIGRIPWCIAPDTTGNMFLNYHRRLNLHMYIGTKVGSRYNNSDKQRKVCFSFSKKNGYVSLMSGNSTVDASNKDLSYEEANKIVGTTIFKILEKDAERPERLEIDPVSYYKSITLIQYGNLENAVNTENQADFQRFMMETGEMAKHTDRPDLLTHFYRKYINEESVREGIQKNRMFNKQFLSQFKENEIYKSHLILYDDNLGSKFVEETMVSFRYIVNAGWREQKKFDEYFSLIGRSNISGMSDKAKNIIFGIVKSNLLNDMDASLWGDWVSTSLYILENNEEMNKRFFSDVSREEIRNMLNGVQPDEITQSPILSRYAYPDNESLEQSYRRLRKEKQASMRKSKTRPTMENNFKIMNLRFVISEEAMLDVLENIDVNSDVNFLGTILRSVCLGRNSYQSGLVYSESTQEKVKIALSELLKNAGLGFKQMFFNNVRTPPKCPVPLSNIEIAGFYYESFKNISNFDRVDGSSLLKTAPVAQATVIMFADSDNNYSFIMNFIKAKRSKDKGESSLGIANNRLALQSALRSLLKAPENEEVNNLLIEICKVLSEKFSNQEIPPEGKSWSLNKIESNIDSFDERLVYCIGFQSSNFDDKEKDLINRILASKNQKAKESLLSLLSLVARSRRSNYNQEEADDGTFLFLSNIVIDNIDSFYLDDKKLVASISALFPGLERDTKLKLVYCDSFDENKNLRVRRAAAESLISEIKLLCNQVTHNIQAAHDLSIADGFDLQDVDLLYLVQHSAILFSKTKDDALNLYSGYTPSQRDYSTFAYNCEKEIKKINIDDYFDQTAYAIDMNKNKLLFEFYFNVSSSLYQDKKDPNDINDPPEDVYTANVVSINRKIQNFFKSKFGDEYPFGKSYKI